MVRTRLPISPASRRLNDAMSYLEALLVLIIAVLVLGPKELAQCAFGLGRLWRWWQSTKAALYAQWLNASVQADKVDHSKHE